MKHLHLFYSYFVVTMSYKGTKRTSKRVGENVSQKKLQSSNHDDNSLKKGFPVMSKKIQLVTPITKLFDYASHAYEHHPQKRNDLIIKIQILTKMLVLHYCQIMVTRRYRLSIHPFKEEIRMSQSPIFQRRIL